jgi:Tol biopolymer transport system component
MAASAALLLILAAVLVSGRSGSSSDRTLRYSIPLPPDGLTFSFALSPDGRYVAVESVLDNRTTQVFLRSLDTEELRPMPGTDGAGNPLWSPDSRHIAFFANEKLKRIPVNGGPAEELADVPGIFGARGTWGRGGVILVAGSSKYDPGRRVDESGGELSPLTITAPGESHWFPQFLSDGQHFLFTSRGGSSPGIYVASLDDPAGRRLLADVSSAHLAPAEDDGGPAHLLFMRDGNLMAQPFDLDSLALVGDSIVLLEQQPSGLTDDGMASVSVDEAGTLVYAGGSVRETDSRFAWLDRSGTVVAREGPIGPAAPVGLSPDESMMIVPRRQRGQWQSDLWRRDLARGSEQRLTFDTLADVASNIVWSPDGGRIVFAMSPAFDLFSMNPLTTSPPQVFFSSDRPKYPTDWSRDGRYLLYTELGVETVADLWYLRLEDAGSGDMRVAEAVPFLQTPFLESGGALSPDGRWIAYMSYESDDSEVYVRPFPAGAGQWKVSDGGANHPRWSADGRELFYLAGPALRRALIRTPVTRQVPASSGSRPVFEYGAPEQLFTLPVNGFHPVTGTSFYAPSRDGRRFLINYIDLTEDPVLHVVTNWREAFGVDR